MARESRFKRRQGRRSLREALAALKPEVAEQVRRILAAHKTPKSS